MTPSTVSNPLDVPSPSHRQRSAAMVLAAAIVGAGIALTPSARSLSLPILPGLLGPTEGLINLGCGLLSSANLCVRVVTHAVVGGNTVVRERDLLPGFGVIGSVLGQPMDVTGDGSADVTVALAVPITLLPPGYNAQKPTLKVTKLSGAPSTLALKLEVVTSDGLSLGRKISVGYDARESTAPSSFVAAIDQSNRDGLADTSQVLVDLTIGAGNSKGVGLVQESFVPGATLAENLRQDRSVTQLTFRAVPATASLPATQMPTTVRLDATSGTGLDRFVITSSPASTADVLLASPEDDPRISGTIARLPGTIDLTLKSVDGPDADNTADKTSIAYTGSEPVPQAQVKFQSIEKDPVPDRPDLPPIRHRRTLDVAATTVPAALSFEYDSKASAVHMNAAARIPSVVVSGVDEKPFFKRATSIRLQLEDVPRILDAGFGDGEIVFEGATPGPNNTTVPDALGALNFLAYDVPPEPDIICPVDSTCDLYGDPLASGLIYDDTSGVAIGDPFHLSARLFKLTSATVISEPNLDVYLDTAPDISGGPKCALLPGGVCKTYRRFLARVRKADPRFRESITTIDAELTSLAPGTLFRQASYGSGTPDPEDDYGEITYSNDGTGGSPDITVEAVNLPGLPTGKNDGAVKNLFVGLTSVPNSMFFHYAGGGFPLKLNASGASDAVLDQLEVRMSTPGATDRLPEQETVGGTTRKLDGVLIRDYTDRYVIHARVRGLFSAIVDKDVHLNTNPCVPFTPECGVIELAKLSSSGPGFVPGPPTAPYPCSEGDAICIQAGVQEGPDRPRLRFDSRTGVAPWATPPPAVGRTAFWVDELIATLDEIPSSLTLRQFKSEGDAARVAYTGARTVPGGLSVDDNKRRALYTNAQIEVGTNRDYINETRVTPMPATFSTCKSPGAACTESIFEESLANSGAFTIDASERTHVTVLDWPDNSNLYTFTQLDLSLVHFAQAAHAADGNSYIALDTGWNSANGEPRAQDTVNGTIDHYVDHVDYQEGEGFVFRPGFAADARRLGWFHTINLVVAQFFGQAFTLNLDGAIRCPTPMNINIKRDIPVEDTVTINLGDDMCTGG